MPLRSFPRINIFVLNSLKIIQNTMKSRQKCMYQNMDPWFLVRAAGQTPGTQRIHCAIISKLWLDTQKKVATVTLKN